MNSGNWLAAVTALALFRSAATFAAPPHNLILFVPDGLRAQIVDAKRAPTMARLRDDGVNFTNSHSLFPTVTTANASAFATGHGLGDTGDFSNDIYSKFPLLSAGNSIAPFLESDPVLREINADFNQNYLNEESIVARAAAAHYSTALIGKLGPIAIFDLNSMDEHEGKPRTLIVDDTSGKEGGVNSSELWVDAFKSAAVATKAPGRGDNGNFGSFDKAGTHTANTLQQQYFLDVVLRVVLPQFKKANRPFVLVYWSRDPDGTQHNQGDSFRSLDPGINGATSMAAIRSADDALAAIEARLKELGLFDTTNIIVAADHGFSTISKASTSPAARLPYDDVNKDELPPGFLAIDLAIALQKADPTVRLFDPDSNNTEANWNKGQHPVKGNGLIGTDPTAPEVIVAANGGSDLIYFSEALAPQAVAELGNTIVSTLLDEDYVSGIFVDQQRLGKIAGALSTESIGLSGKAVTPHPVIVVSFKSFTTGCDVATVCTVVVADTVLQQGQGMHGSFSRADTWNFMAARGPDFRSRYPDPLPASNADIGMTIAHLMHLTLHTNGPLSGRVLTEALRGSKGVPPQIKAHTRVSEPAKHGLRTILKTQAVGRHPYLDVAGFRGRTVGLDSR